MLRARCADIADCDDACGQSGERHSVSDPRCSGLVQEALELDARMDAAPQTDIAAGERVQQIEV